MKLYRHIAILRGINVGGHRKIKMADLRKKLLSLGFEKISTYIQSGNLFFDSPENDRAILAAAIQQLILKEYSFEVPVIVLSLKELEDIARQNPFIQIEGIDVKMLHVTFLEELPAKELKEGISPTPFLPDEFRILGKAVYLYCPNGSARTKLNNNFFEKKLAVLATTRNWRTVNKLIELA